MTLLSNCTAVLASNESSAEAKAAALTVAAAIFSTKENRELNRSENAQFANILFLKKKNLRFLKRCLLSKQFLKRSNWKPLLFAFVELAYLLVDVLVLSDSDSDVRDLLALVATTKEGCLALLDANVLAVLIKNLTAKDNNDLLECGALLSQLISSTHMFLTDTTDSIPLDSTEIDNLRLGLQFFLDQLSFHFKDSTDVFLKFELMRLLSQTVGLCSDMHNSIGLTLGDCCTKWGEYVWVGLGYVLRNKLATNDRNSALILASATFQLLGSDWLFPQSSTEDHHKFATLLIHLTCADLRVILDQTDITKETNDSDNLDLNNPNSNEPLIISHLSLLTTAIKTLVQTFSPSDVPSSPLPASQHRFPAELLISLHHALAESFIAVLSHLIDRFEHYNQQPPQPPVQFTKTNRTILPSIRAIGVWLTEDSQAVTIEEVSASMPLLVAVAREVGCDDLGGCFMNVTAQEDIVDRGKIGDDGDEDVKNCKSKFLECGGGELLKDWVLGVSLEESRVSVCCLLNLVVGDALDVLGKVAASGDSSGNGADGSDFAVVVLGRLLETDLIERVNEVSAIHVMNACCLALCLLRDLGEDGVSESLLRGIVENSIKALYYTRLLERDSREAWDEVSELWFLSVKALTVLTETSLVTAKTLVPSDEFVQLAQYCGELAERGKDIDLSFDRDSSMELFRVVNARVGM
ncbi:UNVERIFIED_CONTAM: hypothetical protein HDU68_008508 [Siphonaria sp. JEL0065]|nr:hypothetical protein HDU68_008508 [Siphonaria sp. JEL0065]